MRYPRSRGARVNREAADDALMAEGLPPITRRKVPPDAWDDLLVSEIRGQAWARKARAAPPDPARLRAVFVPLDLDSLRKGIRG